MDWENFPNGFRHLWSSEPWMLEGQCGLNSCSISLICSGKSVCRYSIPLGGKMLLDPWIRRRRRLWIFYLALVWIDWWVWFIGELLFRGFGFCYIFYLFFLFIAWEEDGGLVNCGWVLVCVLSLISNYTVEWFLASSNWNKNCFDPGIGYDWIFTGM